MNEYIALLIAYAKKYLDLAERDETYVRNRVMDILGEYDYSPCAVSEIPELPDSILQGIFACLDEKNVEYDRATLGEKLMDAVMLKPSEFERKFDELYRVSPEKATSWANDYAVRSDYVKKSAIDKNIRWHAATMLGDKSGIKMEVYTDMPAMQTYTGSGGKETEKAEKIVDRGGVALEPQFAPNAINTDAFEKPILRANEKKRHYIRLEF